MSKLLVVVVLVLAAVCVECRSHKKLKTERKWNSDNSVLRDILENELVNWRELEMEQEQLLELRDASGDDSDDSDDSGEPDESPEGEDEDDEGSDTYDTINHFALRKKVSRTVGLVYCTEPETDKNIRYDTIRDTSQLNLSHIARNQKTKNLKKKKN